MKEKIKNNNNRGFLQIIVLIVVALLIMKYFNITISGVVQWFTSFFSGVLK